MTSPTPGPPSDVRTAASGRFGRGLHVGTVLLLVAAVPLLGMASVTWSDVRDARAVASASTRTEQVAEHAVGLAELDSALFDELVWSAVHAVLSSVPAALDDTTELLGTDPDARLAAARAQTDRLLPTAELPEVAAAVERARAARLDLGEVIDRYAAIATMVEAPLDEVLDTLSVPSVGSTIAGSLHRDVHLLAVAVEARTTLGQLIYGSFTAVFDVRGAPADEVESLIELRHRYDVAIAELTQDPSTPPRLRSAADWLRTGDGVTTYRRALDTFIADALRRGVPERGLDLGVEAFAANLDAFSTMIDAINGSAEPGAAVLAEAAAGVLSSAEAAEDHASADIRRAYLVAAALTIATIAAALLAGRFIVLPLRDLRRAAHDLQTNRKPVIGTGAAGPAEVRAAAQALEDAGAHIDLVTRQARALATGDLDAHVLDEDAPGGLGDALHDAVGVLRTALGQQEEFRRRLAHEAEHDGLTKLANRNASMAQLHRSLARTHRAGSRLALLFVDLDRFKDVNDHYGHQAGDVVLAAVAQRLVNSVREGDHVGRLGGDEFLVIAEPVTDMDDAVELAHRVLAAVDEPIQLATSQVVVGASIGVAVADGGQLTADELLRDADLAVYRAKARGRGGVEVCDEDLRHELAEIADLTSAIRRAVDGDELVAHYQPIVDATTGRLDALEALVRWRRPDHVELVLPADFVDFAERSPLIIDIDRWMLDAVAAQLAAWQREASGAAVPVAVNVSGRHLAHDDFAAHVLEPLARHGVDPRSLIVEVTESALLEDLSTAAAKLERLREAGVRISIDDFGTGYTSLAHLRSLPVDVLKIDRSFTVNAHANAHEESIVKLIIDTGHLLGATITAEGIETDDEAALLRRLGADHLQGWTFGRPQGADEVVTAFSRR